MLETDSAVDLVPSTLAVVKCAHGFMPLQARKRVNALDNKTTSKAIDALLNYETVKLFNNEQLEVCFSAACTSFVAT